MLDQENSRIVMLYLQEKLKPDSRGRLRGVKTKDVSIEGLDRIEVGNILRELHKYNLITVRNPSSVAKRYFIDNITPQGEKFLLAAKDKNLWPKLKKALGPISLWTAEKISQALLAILSNNILL